MGSNAARLPLLAITAPLGAIGGGTAYMGNETVKNVKEQKNAAKAEGDRMKTEIENLTQSLASKAAEEPQEEVKAEGYAKQKAKSASAGGRRSTILTSPLGIVGEPQTSGKSLLGL